MGCNSLFDFRRKNRFDDVGSTLITKVAAFVLNKNKRDQQKQEKTYVLHPGAEHWKKNRCALTDLIRSEHQICGILPSYDYIHLISAPVFDTLYKIILKPWRKLVKSVPLTWAMTPAMLFHQMLELSGAIARVSWTLGFHALLAMLAPDIITVRQRAFDDVNLLVITAIHKHCFLAPSPKKLEVVIIMRSVFQVKDC